MADYGVMLVMDNGNPFVTPQSTPFCLYRRMTANSAVNGSAHVATISLSVDASWPVMVFCKTSNTAQPTGVSATRNGGTITASSINAYAQSHTLTIYVFTIFPQTLPSWGMAIWDAGGKLVLTNESKVLSDLVTVGMPGNNGGINIDQTLTGSWAVSPCTLGSQNVQNNNTQPPTIVNIIAYSGCRYNGTSTRINAAPTSTATGSAAGGTNTGIAITAINTAAYD